MPDIRTQGYVLRVFEYRETSQIAHLLTPDHGNLGVLARGILGRKRGAQLPPPLEPFSLLEVYLINRNPESMALLKEGTQIRAYPELQGDVRLLAVASLIFEVIDKTTEPLKSTRSIFEIADHLLSALTLPTANPLTICAQYLMKILEKSGYQPEMQHCTVCGKTERLEFFSPARGGTVCAACGKANQGEAIRLDPASRKIITRILRSKYAELQSLKLSAPQSLRILEIALALSRYHLTSSQIRSWHFFKTTAFENLFSGNQ